MTIRIKQIYFYLILALVAIVYIACNPTKDKWLNRNWHTLTGHYNVYFNGEQKFLEAVQSFEKGIQNDFNKVLPVFVFPDEAASKAMGGTMDEVIKKTSVAIQAHTVGSYTDDSYLLMAKAQFYKGDYFAALETFQYINSKYKDGDLNKLATAWIAQCYYALNKTGEAEAIMGLLINDIDPIKLLGKKQTSDKLQNKAANITKSDKAFIYATSAHIYIKQEKYGVAAERLKIALASESVKEHKIRYNYILGQLSLISDSIQNAKLYFNKVVKLLPPYDVEFNANLNLTRLYNPTNKKEVKQVKRNLKRMLNDDKNEGLYDQVYYELAKIELRDGDIPNAIKHFQLSANNSTTNKAQKAKSYLALGDIYLSMPNYKLGQAYYDSAAAVVPESYVDYQKIKDKRNVLSELIENVLIIEKEDSLQKLSLLSKDELDAKVSGWILADSLQKLAAEKAAANQAEMAKQAELNKPLSTGGLQPLPAFGNDQGQWYFYNPTILAAGQQEFFSTRKWGRRDNEDFWRIAAKEKTKAAELDTALLSNKIKSDSTDLQSKTNSTTVKPQFNSDKAAWVKDIPYSAEEKQASNTRMLEAYYHLGEIYDVKLKAYNEAILTYKTMLARFPENEFESEVLYHLFKLYQNTNNQKEALLVRDELITKYPESNYALILQSKNPSRADVKAKQEITTGYEAIYELYVNGKYQEAKAAKIAFDKQHKGNAMQSKFDLLYAMCTAKTDSVAVFKQELEDVVKAYPKTAEADKAQSILDALKQNETGGNKLTATTDESAFVLPEEGAYYYVFATKTEPFDINDLLQKMVQYIDEYHQFEALRVNTLLSAEGYQLMYVREFASRKAALDFYHGINLNKFYVTALTKNEQFLHFDVTADFFKKLLKEKKIEAYNTYFSTEAPKLIKSDKK